MRPVEAQIGFEKNDFEDLRAIESVVKCEVPEGKLKKSLKKLSRVRFYIVLVLTLF